MRWSRLLSTTVVPRCPRCQGERRYKNDHPVRGAQRAKGKDGRRTFTLAPKGPRHRATLKEQVLSAYQDRLGLRGIQRTFGVCYLTVRKWLGEKSGSPARLRGHAAARSKRGRARTRCTLELRAGKSPDPLAVGGPLSAHPPDLVAWTPGDRREQSAADWRAALPRDHRRGTTRRDLWRAYRAAFPKRTHRGCAKAEGETCHVERWFGTLRQRVSRRVRKALSFSKCAENHHRRHPPLHLHLQPPDQADCNTQLITTRS